MLPLVFASCTATNQLESFLDGLPRPSNVVFTEDFESGLGRWNTGGDSWTTVTPAANGLALRSPTSTTAATFNLITNAPIDLTGRSGCVLAYETRFNIGGVLNTSARILFGTVTVASLKDSTGPSTVTSSGQFLSRRFRLPDNTSEKLTIQTAVTNNTTGVADLYIDNMTITCANTVGPAVTVTNEDFEGSLASWSFQTPWAVGAGFGEAGSNAPRTGVLSDNADHVASFTTNINLQGRSGCTLRFFHSKNVTGDAGGATCFRMLWNTVPVSTRCNVGLTSSTIEIYLTAYEGLPSNSLSFSCRDSNDGTTTVNCTVDNVVVSCQQ